MSERTHIDTSLIWLRQARSQAYWNIDARWDREGSRATREINEVWSTSVDAIVNDERDGNEEKIRKLILLIMRIKRA